MCAGSAGPRQKVLWTAGSLLRFAEGRPGQTAGSERSGRDAAGTTSQHTTTATNRTKIHNVPAGTKAGSPSPICGR